MKNSLLRRSATLALTIPLVMGLAACSDDSGDNEDSSTATSTSASAKHIKGLPDGFDSVSYTHLTLPTIYSV